MITLKFAVLFVFCDALFGQSVWKKIEVKDASFPTAYRLGDCFIEVSGDGTRIIAHTKAFSDPERRLTLSEAVEFTYRSRDDIYFFASPAMQEDERGQSQFMLMHFNLLLTYTQQRQGLPQNIIACFDKYEAVLREKPFSLQEWDRRKQNPQDTPQGKAVLGGNEAEMEWSVNPGSDEAKAKFERYFDPEGPRYKEILARINRYKANGLYLIKNKHEVKPVEVTDHEDGTATVKTVENTDVVRSDGAGAWARDKLQHTYKLRLINGQWKIVSDSF